MKKPSKKKKGTLHRRNAHRNGYDFPALMERNPELKAFVHRNKYDIETIDFANPDAVKALNRSLLMFFYGVAYWDVPTQYLCPPIPGRADHIHTLADLLALGNGGEVPRGAQVRVLDIGVGANCVYPIIGHAEYGWSFVGTEVDKKALESAEMILEQNPALKNAVELRYQPKRNQIFKGILQPGERFDLSICNPPFHGSAEQAAFGTRRKWKNLNLDKRGNHKNFGGTTTELWCEGGERGFLKRMIDESVLKSKSVGWFSSLVSKQEHLPEIYKMLEKVGAKYRTLDMAQGQKISRIVAWRF